MSDVVLATVTDVLRGLMLTGLLAGAWWAARTFHRAGLARVARGDHVARLRPGMRELTREEAGELVRRQRALEDAAGDGWLSPEHRAARQRLCVYVAQLADDQVPLSRLADAMGVRKQRAHQQAAAGRHLAPT